MSFPSYNQSKKELEKQRKEYKSQISRLNRLLFAEQKNEKNAFEALKDINKKIEVRNKLINTINLEAKLLANQIKNNERKIDKLNKNLSALKADYADMIYKSYKSKSQQSRTMFLLSSQNFYQAYKRLEYMKQYRSFRKKQGEEIVLQAKVIEKVKDSLVLQKKEKDILILSEEGQKKEIEADKKNQEDLISKIKKKESKYKRDLRKNVKEEKRIAAKIDKLIKAEIAKANRATKKKFKSAPKTTKKNEFILSPEAKILASKFEKNKGNLPWPVEESIITRRYGVQPHPIFPGITINSPGMHFTTSKGSDATAIFDGEVLNVLIGSGKTKNVMVRHGNYITSYNHLENAYVKKGDKIVTGQKIGKIFTDKVKNKTTLIFVLFKNTKRLNPKSWLAKR
ncbi:peptidase M23 [Polaribacter porphyrae]|uniref:Peptidase M23 n=1 Tax=Polaribacter porphyrae TaxID=1137780 RepID=A0A2S7WS55_9FLAO|nr:peptidoglycan DD-metalloendopeptidase family protein [Polaribacter porphyrae]PQJ80428.1 peptidase M23 [Polaribacter porphyrae]